MGVEATNDGLYDKKSFGRIEEGRESKANEANRKHTVINSTRNYYMNMQTLVMPLASFVIHIKPNTEELRKA